MKPRTRRTIGAIFFVAWALSVGASIGCNASGHGGAAVLLIFVSLPLAAISVWGVD